MSGSRCRTGRRSLVWGEPAGSTAARSGFMRGSAGLAELVRLGVAAPAVSDSGGSPEGSSPGLLLVLGLQSPPFLQELLFTAGLAEKKQLLVVFPSGQVESVGGPARLDRLVLAVKNRPEVFKLAPDVGDCRRRRTEGPQTPW